MKTDLLLTAAGAAIGVATVAVNKLLKGERRLQPTAAEQAQQVAFLRQRLAATLDSLHAAEAANGVFRQGIAARDADLADAQAQMTRAADAIQGLIKALNAANVRCAELQSALHRQGLSAESAYFLAVLGDGTVAGPFSRN